MRVLLNGSLAGNRAFVSEELPAWVRQVTLSVIWGAQTLSKMLKADRFQQSGVPEDSPSRFEASVWLDKSRKLVLGMRRIGIRAIDHS